MSVFPFKKNKRGTLRDAEDDVDRLDFSTLVPRRSLSASDREIARRHRFPHRDLMVPGEVADSRSFRCLPDRDWPDANSRLQRLPDLERRHCESVIVELSAPRRTWCSRIPRRSEELNMLRLSHLNFVFKKNDNELFFRTWD